MRTVLPHALEMIAAAAALLGVAALFAHALLGSSFPRSCASLAAAILLAVTLTLGAM